MDEFSTYLPRPVVFGKVAAHGVHCTISAFVQTVVVTLLRVKCGCAGSHHVVWRELGAMILHTHVWPQWEVPNPSVSSRLNNRRLNSAHQKRVGDFSIFQKKGAQKAEGSGTRHTPNLYVITSYNCHNLHLCVCWTITMAIRDCLCMPAIKLALRVWTSLHTQVSYIVSKRYDDKPSLAALLYPWIPSWIWAEYHMSCHIHHLKRSKIPTLPCHLDSPYYLSSPSRQ